MSALNQELTITRATNDSLVKQRADIMTSIDDLKKGNNNQAELIFNNRSLNDRIQVLQQEK